MASSPSPGQYVYDNATEEEPEYFSLGYWMWIVTTLIALLGLAGNGTVLWLLGFRIQRNPFSVYILHLAGADALFLCCSSLVSLHVFVNSWHYSFKYELLIYFGFTFYTVGLSLLAAISTERCLSALFPIWYRCHRPKRTSAVLCALLWLLSSLFWLGFALCEFVPVHYRYSCYSFEVFLMFWLTLLPGVLCASSLTLLLRVQCGSQRRQPPRLYLLVLLTVLVFLICGLAPGIDMFTRLFHKPVIPFWIPWLLASVNSTMNPFIYFFLGTQRLKNREPLRVILQRALADEQELGRESRDTPRTDTGETSS